MTLLGRMQSLLAALYDAPVAHDVHDYLITDPAHAAALQELPSPPTTSNWLSWSANSLPSPTCIFRKPWRKAHCTSIID